MSAAARSQGESGGAETFINVRNLGRRAYIPLWEAMRRFTDERDGRTRDEIWFAEHPRVFTLGLNAAPEHLLAPGDIEVVKVDRGGQVTFHGPGQLMIYPLLNLRRAGLGVRDVVTALEQAAIALLREYDVIAVCRRDAPGVYVDGKKVASVGLRIRRGSSYHGMALNVDMDLEPFSRINPCGYEGLEVIDFRSLGIDATLDDVRTRILGHLVSALGLEDRQRIESASLKA